MERGQGGVCLDGVVWPVRRERRALHWLGQVRKRGEWGRRVVRVVCASGMWGQRFRVRRLFVKCHGVVRARVRSVGWVRGREGDLRFIILMPTLAQDNLQLKAPNGKTKIVPGSTN